MSKCIAVIGGGIFGSTIALRLHADGHRIKLIESRNDILKGTSFNNTRREFIQDFIIHVIYLRQNKVLMVLKVFIKNTRTVLIQISLIITYQQKEIPRQTLMIILNSLNLLVHHLKKLLAIFLQMLKTVMVESSVRNMFMTAIS